VAGSVVAGTLPAGRPVVGTLPAGHPPAGSSGAGSISASLPVADRQPAGYRPPGPPQAGYSAAGPTPVGPLPAGPAPAGSAPAGAAKPPPAAAGTLPGGRGALPVRRVTPANGATTRARTGAATVSEPPASASWQALGTLVQLVVTDPRDLPEAQHLLAAELAAVDAACSRFRPDSEIRSLRTARGRPARVSPLLAEAIGVALRAARLTEGDVDPTVGAAMSAIGYDRDFGLVPRTGPPLTVTARTVPGWREIHLEGQSLTMPEGVQLDLGATAKAWAADRAATHIAGSITGGVLVSLGGDIAVAGSTPEGGWRIRVQDVTGSAADAPSGPYALIAVRDGGLATSSTAARRWQRGGDLLHHILDPRTGRPADAVWRTVSVAAGTCADANAASTAAVIRGRQALGWLARLGLPSRLVDATGVVFTVAGWPGASETAQN
jgi:thiamine biosynthesis lipoprotein ApbE